jgi:hypothetical protein
MKMHQKRKLVPQKIGRVDKRRRPRGLTRAIKTAIDAIVFDRCTRTEACKRAGITERALYLGLEKVEVAAYWNRQTEVLRQGERARTIHRLTEIRDAADNMPAVNASKMLLEAEESQPLGSRAPIETAGLIIVVRQPRLPEAPLVESAVVIDAEPKRVADASHDQGAQANRTRSTR